MSGFPPPYRFFQTAIAPPDDDGCSIAASPPSPPSDRDLDVHPLDPGLPNAPSSADQTPVANNSIVKVVVRIKPDLPGTSGSRRNTQAVLSTSPTTQRTLFLQKSIISRHSARLRVTCEPASKIHVDLDGGTFSLAAFQNFVDFSHSNIYSVNKSASDYHVIYSHVQAWLLGAKLAAPTYQAAALRELYPWIEPAHSPIRAEDVDFVCSKTPEDCILRALFFDAVAARWTQLNAITIGANPVYNFPRETAPEPYAQLDPPPTLTWKGLYSKHRDFRKRTVGTVKVRDSQRARLLRPVEDYITGKARLQGEDFVNEVVVGSWFGDRGLARPRPMPYGRRRESGSGSREDPRRGRSAERQVDEEYMTMGDA
ncbi:hypothetical protein PMIN04_001566 [Paraphaeosphaeria minitans]